MQLELQERDDVIMNSKKVFCSITQHMYPQMKVLDTFMYSRKLALTAAV